ncbi:MAG: hypothetical protein ACT4QB_12435 [Gammaproteobacteria bacterium]
MKTTPRSPLPGPARPFHPFGRGLLVILSAFLLDLPIPAPAASGDLDPSFDGDGKVLTDVRGHDTAYALVVQSDGKLVVAGAKDAFSSSADFVLARYNPDGSLDSSFGNGGRVVTDFGAPDRAFDLVLQPDGKLVVAGGNNAGDLILARYNPGGTLDASFGVGGLVVITDACCGARDLVLQPDGKLVVVDGDLLYRINPDGTRDASFGSNGSAFSEITLPNALALQPDAKLVAAGVDVDFANHRRFFALERFNADGSRDTGFGPGGGRVVTDFGEDSDAEALVLQPDGKLVAAGSIGSGNSANRDFVLARYHPDGRLDGNFGSGGLVRTDIESGGALTLSLQVDGKLVAGGGGRANGDNSFALARYLSDGSLDTSFGTGGVVLTDFGGNTFTQRFFSLSFQPDGKLVMAGNASPSGDLDFALARYLTTNELPPDPPALPPPGSPEPPSAPPPAPLTCGGRLVTILGTAGNDTIRGTLEPDVIVGRGGNDTIRGLAGNDTICGGPGRDTLVGNEGNDRLFGEGGNDKLFGDEGSDRLDGGRDRDTCRKGEKTRNCERKAKPADRPKDPPPVPPPPPCTPVGNVPCS